MRKLLKVDLAVLREERPGRMDNLPSVGAPSSWVDDTGCRRRCRNDGLEKGCPRARCCPPAQTPISKVIPVCPCSLLVFLTVSWLSGLGHPLLSCLCCERKQLLCSREGGLSSSPLQARCLYTPGGSHFSIYSCYPNLGQESNPIKHNPRGLLL